MLARVWVCAALVALASASQDFEFDDGAPDADTSISEEERRLRKYVYDPHSPLCRALVCRKREVCLLRDSYTALCANKKDILRKGGVIVATSSTGGGDGGGAEPRGGDEDDDVFYDGGGTDLAPPPPDRCVGCSAESGAVAAGGFLCGSDNRTYSSLCRLRLHNCVRRPAPAVTRACAGYCPCAPPRHARVLPAHPPEGSGCALDRMADRLLDWFSVLMEEARGKPPPATGFPAGCKPEVRWMFAHLDGDGSGSLSARELYALRHDDRERCLRPFLAGCGGGGGAGAGGVARAAWCGCLRRAARPCAALARAARARGGWAPACDARGFYRPRQCHAALAVCWCVDAHGVEAPRSRTKGRPACRRRAAPPPPPPPPARPAPPDDEDEPGSGDAALDMRY